MSKGAAWYDRELAARRDRLASERARMAETGMSPYDEMTKQVEQETGTDSKTWSMLDDRWERVVWLTRDLLGLAQDKHVLSVTRPHQTVCKYGHDLTDPKNVYKYTRPDGYVDHKCRTCQRRRIAEHRNGSSTQQAAA